MKKDLRIAQSVKEILDLIRKISPGQSVELRIPPYGAIQCIPGGNHKRGTPPNTVEMSAKVLIQLSQNPERWEEFMASGQITASGVASDLSPVFSQLSKEWPVGRHV